MWSSHSTASINSWRLMSLFKKNTLYFGYVGEGGWGARVCHSMMWRSEDNFKKLVFSFNHVGPRDQTWLVKSWWQMPLPAEPSLQPPFFFFGVAIPSGLNCEHDRCSCSLNLLCLPALSGGAVGTWSLFRV